MSRSTPFSLNQPNSFAMYSGHCSAPWLTNPSTIFVCARAPAGNNAAPATITAAAQVMPKLTRKLSHGADFLIGGILRLPWREFSIRRDHPDAQLTVLECHDRTRAAQQSTY